MPTFIYKAKDKYGKTIEGNIIAESQKLVIDKLGKMDYFPILIQEKGVDLKETLDLRREFLPIRAINLKKVAIFTRQLSDLLESGLPLNKALTVLHQHTKHKGFQMLTLKINRDIQQGVRFSEALNKYPKIFPRTLVWMIKVGEASGMLDQMLDKAADYLEKIDDLRTKMKSALTYPCFLIAVGMISISFLMIFIMPKLVIMFEDLGQNLPLPTLILIWSSNFISQYWWLILASLIVIIFGLKRTLTTPRGSWLIHKFLLSLPYLGKMIKEVELLKFALNLATLLINGVPLLESLKIVSNSSENLVIKKEIDRLYKEVDEGKRLANSLSNKENFSDLMTNILAVAEEGGFLEKALLKVATNYEREIDRKVKVMTSLVEPMVILSMGVIVGFIVIAMLLPIFRMNILVE